MVVFLKPAIWTLIEYWPTGRNCALNSPRSFPMPSRSYDKATVIPPMLLLPAAVLPEEDANTRALGHNSSRFSE